MKKTSIISLSILAIMSIWGCAEKEDIVLIHKYGSIIVEGSMPDDTKTAINGIEAKWTSEDKIGVFAQSGDDLISNVLFSAGQIDETGKHATFGSSVDIPWWNNVGNKTTYGYYPYDSEQNEETVTFTIDAFQTQTDVEANHLGRWDFMVAPPVQVSAGIPSLDFHHLMSKLDITIKNETGETVKISKIAFRIDEKLFVTSASVAINKSAGEAGYLEMTPIQKSGQVGLNIEGGDYRELANGEEVTVNMMLIPVDLRGKEMEITIHTDKGGQKIEVQGRKFETGHRYKSRTAISELRDFDREALIALYNATNGANWTNNTNWCSDKPLSEWYGVRVDEENRVSSLDLRTNQLTGSIPVEIGNLTNLKSLFLFENQLVGSIPTEIGNLTNLTDLILSDNQLTGSIPAEIGQLTNLNIRLILSNNQLTGSIPTEIGLLTNLGDLGLSGNQLTGSIPAEIGNLTKIWQLALGDNQLSGSIPAEIGQMTALSWLHICDTQLSGSIPTEIGQLTKLRGLHLWGNQLTGSIPNEIGQLTKLTELDLSNNQVTGTIPVEIFQLTNLSHLSLSCNQLTGSIPSEIGQLTNLTNLFLMNNLLSGKIPQSVQESLVWMKFWPTILRDNNFDMAETTIPTPDFNTTDVNGGVLESSKIYAENSYTVLYFWTSWCPYSSEFTPKLKRLYEGYHSSGLEVIGYSDEDASTIQRAISDFGMPWRNFIFNIDISNDFPLITFVPAVNVVDNKGKIVFNCATDDRKNLEGFLKEQLGEGDFPDYYESTDYTSDGNVTTLQTSTVGDGVNVILVGDGFTDKDIADGKYDAKMQFAAEHFFDEEPVKSMQNRFNVYSVTAVSKNGVFADDAETAFSGYFGGGTYVEGDNNKVFEYAKKVPGITDSELTESIVIVIMNSSRYAGTCWMYDDNAAIAYFPYGTDDEMFGQLLNHEAVGHGFGKLLDEYSYTGTIPQADIDSYLAQKGLGWGMNVDVTDDPATINWSHFLSDSRYTGQVSIYEGALCWEHGAENSIMRYNTGGFNAPSREAIYKRIIELSGGTYSYEDFVAHDAINRTSGASAVRKAQAAKVDAKTFVPLHEPVIIKRAHDQ